MATRSPLRARLTEVIRTCAGCGVRGVKSDLLRLVAVGSELVPDPRARMPGRGVYLHLSQGCLERAERRRAFPRMLHLPGPLGTSGIAEYLVTAMPGGKLPGQVDVGTGTVPGKAG
ncbi:MAG: YlxR family protein [Actinomycetota bacterium]